ncbi:MULTISPECIES: P2 family phage major capsid protein [unclassified Lonepinella]|uniref:P2 family phage major capsid protein n=1 Tax=unclassified Lonepinella TaxID=2642006 RepID=UPI0036DC2532
MSILDKVKESLKKDQSSMGNEISLDNTGYLEIDNRNKELEQELLKNLSETQFFNLINIVKTQKKQGESIGIILPTTFLKIEDDNRIDVQQAMTLSSEFDCKKLTLDSYILHSKIDSNSLYSGIDLNKTLNQILDKQWIYSLLNAGFTGEINWLKKIQTNKPDNVINGAKVGDKQTYKSINAVVKAGLEKLGETIKNSGDFVAICGRNIIPDHPVILQYGDLNPDHTHK